MNQFTDFDNLRLRCIKILRRNKAEFRNHYLGALELQCRQRELTKLECDRILEIYARLKGNNG